MAVVTQAEFARLSNAGRATVAGWIEKGIIGGDALVRRGGKLLIDAEKASQQVRSRRDIGQALGNGLHIRTLAKRPAEAPQVTTPPKPVSVDEVLDSARCERLFGSPTDPYERGYLDGLLALAYAAPALAVFHAIQAGAPLPVAYALFKGLTISVHEETADRFGRLFLPGPIFPTRYPADWDPAAVTTPPWAAHAEGLGEPVDVPAWEAWAAERDRVNYPDDEELDSGETP